MSRHSPVQQWLDSLPAEAPITDKYDVSHEDVDTSKELEDTNDENVTPLPVEPERHLPKPAADLSKRRSLEGGLAASTPRATHLRKRLQRDHSLHSEGTAPKQKNPLLRDYSLQSDGSGSSGSSVLNVLGARRMDAEALLLALGFGPNERQQQHQRIPDRFLRPSKLKGISTEQFIQSEQYSMKIHDCGVSGYRGLTEHCTPVCRFMRPAPGPAPLERAPPPEIAVQSSCSTINDSC